MKYYEIKRFARKLRLNPTPSEKILWKYLSNKKLEGRKFLRQHPIIYDRKNNDYACFIPDFYCRSEMLIIELDGGIHDAQKEYDRRRDEILISMDYRILRIKNEELKNINLVLKQIRSHFRNHTPP